MQNSVVSPVSPDTLNDYCLRTSQKTPCLIQVPDQRESRDVAMAAKAGDNPDSLMALCTAFCLRNLRRTMCYLGDRNKLTLRPDVFLPSEICDKLVNA